MTSFNHFVLTRFNVRDPRNTGNPGIRLTPEWLNYRFSLFDRFCYPSVLGQINQDFKWFVYFDAETPAEFKQKIDKYANWKNFIPIYLDEPITVKIDRAKILEHLDQEAQYVITTRLDNDDAISKHFVEQIHSSFKQQEFEFINFLYGYVWHKQRTYSFEYDSNPFVSLIEKITERTPNGFKTIMSTAHSELGATAKQIKTEPLWLQVIHEKNISNRVRGIRQPNQKLGNNFLVAPECLPIEENLLDFWTDRTLSAIRYPIDIALLKFLPTKTRASLKKFLLKKKS